MVVAELLHTAERLYEEEDARFRYAEGKAGVLIAASGAALLAVLSRVPEAPAETPILNCLRFVTAIAATALLTTAFVLGTVSLLPRDVKRIGPEGLAEEAGVFQDPLTLRKHLLSLYSAATQKNVDVTDRKMKLVTLGIVFLALALLIVAIAAVVQLAASAVV